MLTDRSFLLRPSVGNLRFARRLIDRSCGPRLQNLVLSREKRNFAAPDAELIQTGRIQQVEHDS